MPVTTIVSNVTPLPFPIRQELPYVGCPYTKRSIIRNQNPPYGRYYDKRIREKSLRTDGLLILRENDYFRDTVRERVGSALWWQCNTNYGSQQGNTLNATNAVATSSTPPYVIFDDPDPPDTLMVNKLLDKWKQSEFNLGVTMGEGPETIRAAYRAAKNIIGAVKQLKKGNLSGALRHFGRIPNSAKKSARRALDVGDLASAWMSCRYGWVPLIGDIAALDKLQYDYNKLPKIIASTYRVGRVEPVHKDYGKIVSSYAVRKFRWQAFIDEEKISASLPVRMGLTDPFSIAWELVPLSFVVDWFLPVSHTLKAFEGIRVLPVSSITKTQYFVTRYNLVPLEGKRKFRNVEGGYKYSRMYLNRSVRQSLPSGFSLATHYPARSRVQNDTVQKRVVDAVILAGSRIQSLIGKR